MSFQLDQQKGKVTNIEMPPLDQAAQEAPKEYAIHPQIQASLPQEEVSEEVSEQPEQQIVQEEAPVKKYSMENDANVRELRQRAKMAEKLEWERDELKRRLQEMQSGKPQETLRDEDNNIDLAPDALAEGKHLTKMDRKVKELEKQLKSYQMQSAEALAEQKVKMQYPDFDRVVSSDNIEMLRQQYPDLAEMIHHTPDIYKKASSAYTLIKQMGIYKDDSYNQEKAMAQKNAAKPKPLASISPQQGDTPLSKVNAFAHGLTDELKEQLRKEMFDARKRM